MLCEYGPSILIAALNLRLDNFQETFLDIGWPLMSHLFAEKATEEKVDEATSHNDGGDVEDYDYDHEKDDLDSDADVLG